MITTEATRSATTPTSLALQLDRDEACDLLELLTRSLPSIQQLGEIMGDPEMRLVLVALRLASAIESRP
jgi:hypothetical protein